MLAIGLLFLLHAFPALRSWLPENDEGYRRGRAATHHDGLFDA